MTVRHELDPSGLQGHTRVAVLASGRGSNFEALCLGDTRPGVVTLLVADRPGTAAVARAGKLGVETVEVDPGPWRTKFSLEAEQRLTDTLIGKGIGLVCLAGLMRILKGPLLEAFQGCVMNIHPSLLPSFPGLHAQRQALEYGVMVSGCTVHYVDSGTDTGPVILQRMVEILPGDDVESLSERILSLEHEAYPEAVRLHCSGLLHLDGRRVLREAVR
jgi:phosphoribosylglycinamide formyltransferase 1